MTDKLALRLYLWSDHALYLGQSPDNDLHRHHAAQICLSVDGALTVHHDQCESRTAGVLIPPDTAHRIDANGARLFVLYVEPEGEEYEAVVAPLLAADSSSDVVPLSLFSAHLFELERVYQNAVQADQVWSICVAALGVSAPATEPHARDRRIEHTIRCIRENPSMSYPLDQLARAANISPSRLSHLFRAQVGVPIRRFIVWARIRQVVLLAIQGATLTDAAHAAGFSDAAHMSNAFRQMFGFAPSTLFARHIRKTVQLMD